MQRNGLYFCSPPLRILTGNDGFAADRPLGYLRDSRSVFVTSWLFACPPIRALALVLGGVLALLLPVAARAQTSPEAPKRVLILYSFDNEEGLYSGLDHVLRSQLRLRVRGRVEFYTEFLDLVRFPALTHAQETVRLLKLKYAWQKPDLVVPVSYSALQFMFQSGKDTFPGTPIVALFNERRRDELEQFLARNPAQPVTGVASTDDPAGTIALALQLQPDTKHVAVVVGSSPLEQFWLFQLKADFSSFRDRVDFIYLDGLSIDELSKKVSELPPHTIIFSSFFFQDATGQFFFSEEVLDLIAREAHVPIYSIYSNYIGHGVVGGKMTNSQGTGRKLADLAAAVLNGETANSIPVATDDEAQNTVDWRQMQRWGISEARVPKGTLELFREPSAWQRYRRLILTLIAVCILEAVLFFALVLNIQRRRRAEKGLNREKALADAVIEGLPGIFLLQDKAGRNVRWNANAARVSRTPLGQVEPLGNVDEDDKEALLQARQRVFQQGSAHVEGNILTEGGRSVPFYFTGVKVELEGEPYLAAVGIDLTERKKAEEALRQSESEIRSLVDNAPYGIATINVRQDRFLHANPAMIKLLGYKSEAEVQALTVSRDLYFEGDSAGFRAQPTSADFFNAVEFTWRRKDGKAVNVRASGRRITQGVDRGDLIELIAEDVTARRTLEEQLRHSQKMEALGQLSGSVAHDFNNLLSVVIGYSELLCTKPELDSLMRSYLESIKKAGERAASLTSQLLAFSRRQVMQPSVINLNILVRETENMLRRLMREDIEQEFILESALWKTRADPGQMIQVILNLAINGRDAMPKGGKLTFRTANVTFDDIVSIHGIDVSPGSYVLLSVTDTGTGMDAQTLDRVFEPFFTTKDAGKGTGLGLATVYGIVKQSGGYVFADSEMGKGSTFTIHLPQCEQRAAAPVSEGRVSLSRNNGRNGSETLLVVEDETAFRDLLRDGLQARGFEVLIAANGVEALRVAEQFHGDIRLLVTDVIMPHMSGPELARALKKQRPSTDVIYISGYTDDKLREENESGELMLLRKPFYIDELLVKIQEVLGLP